MASEKRMKAELLALRMTRRPGNQRERQGHVKHVDDFIDDPKSDRYAASWFEAFRRPAWDKLKEPDERKLFATRKGKRYRVTGCSRLGDVWLHDPDYTGMSYKHRVDVTECSEWSATPKGGVTP